MASVSTRVRVREALDRRAFSAVYQPLVDVSTGSVVSFEALLRWYERDSLVMPTPELVELLEETGMIVEIGPLMIEEVTRQQRRWVENGVGGRRVFVNLSLRELDANLVTAICRAVECDGALLGIEITESSVEKDIDIGLLEELRARGVSIAVDDFGTGYSSLSRLQSLPADVLKIDRMFVERVDDPRDAAIVRSIVELGHALGMVVVAEGIETKKQWLHLSRLGVDRIQGFLVGRPASARETVDLLAA